MSDKSDEDLVGDVDMDFDLQENTVAPSVTKTAKQVQSVKEKSAVPAKPPVKKKAGVKAPLIDDDLLQAFSFGATTCVKPTNMKGSNVKKKASGGDKGKADSSKGNVKQVTENVNKQTKVQKNSKQSEGSHKTNKQEEASVRKSIEKAPSVTSSVKISTFSQYNQETVKVKKEVVESSETVEIKQEVVESSHEEKKDTTTTINEADINTVKQENKPDKKEMHTDNTKTQKQAVEDKSTPDQSSKTSVTKTSPTKHTTQILKRKTDGEAEIKFPAKVQKTDSSSEVKNGRDSKKDADIPSIKFTEEDYKSMDNCLADQMLDKVRQKVKAKSGIKYTVQVSPFEIADLAHPSVQQLIQLHPNMSMIFKRQAVKFRKKKGFAEASFTTMTDLKEFVYQLTQIKVFEKRIEVTITDLFRSDVLSLVIHLNRNGKLLNLLNSSEDPLINRPMPIGDNPHRVQFEKVPRSASGAFMHSMFPFTNNVLVTRSQVGKDTKPVYYGPVSVIYINAKWLEAVMDCCSDFIVNGFPLVVIGDYVLPVSLGDVMKKMEEESEVEKRVAPPETEQRRSETKRTKSMEVDEQKDADYDDNDPVANMTRDVCADMLDSIQKLRELEPNNPNIKKMEEMQRQLTALQNSLRKRRGPLSDVSIAEGNQYGESISESKLTAAERKQKEIEHLEKQLEEKDRAERLKEEHLRQEREKEIQRERESALKKKSQWAKSVLSDFKHHDRRVGERVSEGAEKILQQREQRIREKVEEEKRRKAVEELRRQEEEKLRLQREEEEKRRETERKLLIQKIEETRLRDSQKKDKFSVSQLLWNPSSDSRSHSSSRQRDDDQHYKKRESTSRSTGDGNTATGPDVVDEGIDERLANFALELVQQGKIERDALPSSSTDRSGDRHFPANKNEPDDFLIISEEEYNSRKEVHKLPSGKFCVRIAMTIHRRCPVEACPAKSHFRDADALREHWAIFHKAETTMRFCPRCTAYFVNPGELVTHIMKVHSLSSHGASEMMRNARVKIIPNPSYRDPYPFLSPL